MLSYLLDDSAWFGCGSFLLINLYKFADVCIEISCTWQEQGLMLQPSPQAICKHSVIHLFLEEGGLLPTLLGWPQNLRSFAINFL